MVELNGLKVVHTRTDLDLRGVNPPYVTKVEVIVLSGGVKLSRVCVRITPPQAFGMPPETLHSMKHLVDKEMRNSLPHFISVGILGSLTGLEFIVNGDVEDAVVEGEVLGCLDRASKSSKVPHVNERTCGMISFHSGTHACLIMKKVVQHMRELRGESIIISKG
jgi:S-ribosylhomocysteine lyase LuxS involved in autoinducer biosynthesis